MGSENEIFRAVRELAAERPADRIGYADIARRAGVHWTTVRRRLGDKRELKRLLLQTQEELGISGEDGRTRLLDAGIRVFARHGYAGATMDQVAAEAGQTKGAVYWHFANKAELYLAICRRNLEQQARVVPQQAETIVGAGRPEEALAEWLSEQLRHCMAVPERPLLFFEFLVSSRDPDARESLRQAFATFYGAVAGMFTGLQERGALRADADPRSLAVFIQTVLNGLLVSWMLAPAELEAERFASDAARLLWNGLAPIGKPVEFRGRT